MDPGDVPTFLPELTQVEEMLMSRVHTIIEVRQVHGQQYFYRGHVAHFLTDAPKIHKDKGTDIPRFPVRRSRRPSRPMYGDQ